MGVAIKKPVVEEEEDQHDKTTVIVVELRVGQSIASSIDNLIFMSQLGLFMDRIKGCEDRPTFERNPHVEFRSHRDDVYDKTPHPFKQKELYPIKGERFYSSVPFHNKKTHQHQSNAQKRQLCGSPCKTMKK